MLMRIDKKFPTKNLESEYTGVDEEHEIRVVSAPHHIQSRQKFFEWWYSKGMQEFQGQTKSKLRNSNKNLLVNEEIVCTYNF